MIKHFKNLLTGAGALAVALIAPLAPSANAESFNMTNNLSSSVANILSWPTNSQTTNGIGQQTGGPIGIQNYRQFGLDFQGFLVNTNTTNGARQVVLWLAGSGSQNPPIVSVGTNVNSSGVTVTNQNDWTTNGNGAIVIPLPASFTNWFHWRTNFNNTSVFAEDTYVGIYQASNNLDANCFITNSGNNMATIEKKIVPIRYP